MQVSQKGESLKFGQIISISPLTKQFLCLHSSGHIDSSVNLQEIHSAIMTSGSRLNECLFKIYPQFVTSRLNQALQMSNESNKQKFKDVEQKLIVEYKMNIETSQKLHTIPLQFNQSIQLMHISTNKFLSCNFRQAVEEQENFSLELSEFPSSNSCFRLLPAFLHQQGQDAQVYSKDSMYIVLDDIYIGKQPKLNMALKENKIRVDQYFDDRVLFSVPNLKLIDRISKTQNEDAVFDSNRDSNRDKDKRMRRKNNINIEQIQRFNINPEGNKSAIEVEVNVSLERSCAWVANIFSDEILNENIMQFGDIGISMFYHSKLVWIHHIEENSFISMNRNYQDELIVSYQKVGANETQEFQGNSNGMFQLESQTMKYGGSIEWGKPIRLRHLSMGKYLAVNKDKQLDNKGSFLIYMNEFTVESSLFQFIPLPTTDINSKFVTKDALFKLKTFNYLSSQWVHFSTFKQVIAVEDSILVEESDPILVCRLSNNEEDEDVLKLYKAEYSEVMENLFLLQCFPILKRGLVFLRQDVKTQVPGTYLQELNLIITSLNRVLLELDKFCRNQLINTQLDNKGSQGANPDRQRVMREFFFIEMILDIMKYISTEEELKMYDYQNRKQHKKNLFKRTQSQLSMESEQSNRPQQSESYEIQEQPKQITDNFIVMVSAAQKIVKKVVNHKKNHRQTLQLIENKVTVLKGIYQLLISICQNNPQNQWYVYNKFSGFIYQVRYFQEATNCIISIISSNETILLNLCDKIKLNEKYKQNKIEKQSMNDSNMSLREKISEQKSMEFNELPQEQMSNNIMLFFKQITEEQVDTRNIQYIQFFRAVCRFENQGVSDNQEMLFKFIKQSENFKNKLFINIVIETTKMKLQIAPKQIVYLTSVKDQQIKDYIVSQVNLFADLSLERNYLWRSYLQRIFPTKFVFDQIFDENNSVEYRSSFCNLAKSIYVDQEPFSKVQLPKLCRMMIKSEDQLSYQKMPKMNANRKTKFSVMTDHLKVLVDQSLNFLSELSKDIYKELIKMFYYRNKLVPMETDPKLTNQLVLDIVNLIITIINFDILKNMKRNHELPYIFKSLIMVLEYNGENALYSYLQQQQRTNKIAKAEETSSQAKSAFKAISEIATDIQSSMLGLTPKQQNSLEVQFSEYDTISISRNPIISSLVTISGKLAEAIQSKTRQSKHLEIKIQICDLLSHLQDRRQEFYISNFIRYFHEKGQKLALMDNSTDAKQLIEDEIKTDVATIMPPLMRSGIDSIDSKILSKRNLIYNQEASFELGGLMREAKKFKNYLPAEEEVPDLDTLMSATEKSTVKLEVLPTLLIQFYTANDVESIDFLDKLIMVMRHLFQQKKQLFNYLKNVELLFKEQDIISYSYLQYFLVSLQDVSQCSELWIVDFLGEPAAQNKEINKILRYIQDIHSLLFLNTKIDENGHINVVENDTISVAQQKIFLFLKVHVPIVELLRDVQNQLIKVLNDNFYSQETKDTCHQVLQRLYAILADFCHENTENQNALYPDISLFLDEVRVPEGQIELVCAIFKDNWQLCERVPDSLLELFLNFIKLYGRQERFLKIFSVLQKCRGNYILENQIKIRKCFIPQQVNIENYTDIHEYRLFGQFIQDEYKSIYLTFDFSINSPLIVDEPYLYHCTLINILIMCIQGEEGLKLNIPKIKMILNLHYLLVLAGTNDKQNLNQLDFEINIQIKDNKNFELLRPPLMDLITQFYINNSVIDQSLFIKEQNTFASLINLEYEIIREANSTFPRSQKEYVFDHLLVMLYYYIKNLVIKDSQEEYKERQDYLNIMLLVDEVNRICKKFLINSLTNQQYNNMVSLIYSVDLQLFKDNAGIYAQCICYEEMELDEDKQKSSNIESDVKDSKWKNKLSTVQFMGKKKNKVIDTDTNQEKLDLWYTHELWETFFNACNDSTFLKEEQDLELILISDCFQKIDQFIPDQVLKEINVTVSFNDILRKLIRFIEQGVYNKVDHENLIFVLQILIQILNSSTNLTETQLLFDSCHGMRMVLNLLANFQANPIDDDLLSQLLIFAGLMVKNGNHTVQQSVFNYLSNFEKSELIFLKINQIIYEVTDEIKAQLRKKAMNPKTKEEKSNEIYLQDANQKTEKVEEEDKEALKLSRTKDLICIQIMKFLQLICEGHYLEMQNYLRYQYNSRNNYNILQTMVELVCTAFQQLQPERYEVMMNALETLIELVQGPCSQNQQDMIDSKFLEVASQILRLQQKRVKSLLEQKKSINKESEQSNRALKQQYKQSQQPVDGVKVLAQWMISRLKYKTMVLTTSLLELNTDDSAIRRIMRSLPVDVLKENMISVYKNYKKEYGDRYARDAVNHIYAEYPEETSYHQLIIETGFYIYFLICYYSELSTSDVDAETTRELGKIQREALKRVDPLAAFKNNIIGQVILLTWSLVEGILVTINSIRIYVQKKIKERMQVEDESQEDAHKRRNKKKLQALQIFQESGKFFARNSASIEVVRNGKLERIVFFNMSYCSYLPKENKTVFHESVDRDSVSSKINDLVAQSDTIIEICKHEEDLALFFEQNKFIAVFANYVVLWKDLAYLLTLMLNLLIILSYYDGEGEDRDKNYEVRVSHPTLLNGVLDTDQTSQLFRVLGYLMIICSSFVVSFFLLKKGPLYAREAWSQSEHLMNDEQGWLIRYGLKLFLVGNCIVKVLLNGEVLYYLFYIILAFLATFGHPFFFAFHLTEVVLRYPTLRNIIRSFWEPKTALFLTLVLILISNYYFSLISYIYYPYLYQKSDDDENPWAFKADYRNKCKSLLVCFMATFDQGFKNNGGIGGWFDGNQQQDPKDYSYTRFIYENLNNIVIQLIMIQIFSGIIIDTFSSLREQELEKVRDINEICFICGLQRESFDRQSESGFVIHTKKDHYLWNYIFYLGYLQNKVIYIFIIYQRKSDYNGVESYISNKVKDFDNSWFPIGQALGLMEGEENSNLQHQDLENINTEIGNLKLLVTGITENIYEIQNSLIIHE